MNTVFVTGTDTGVGKTLVSKALIEYWVDQGYVTSGFKPVAAGAEYVDGQLQNEDAQILMSVANCEASYSQVNPIVLEAATAPHIAAEYENIDISIAKLNSAYESISTLSDYVVVEGAGGWQVPLNRQYSFADWVSEKKWPVLLVVDIKLGCINHARLSYFDILRCGNPIIGWVANVQSNDVEYFQDMISSIDNVIRAPLIGCVPPLDEQNIKNLTEYLHFDRLHITS